MAVNAFPSSSSFLSHTNSLKEFIERVVVSYFIHYLKARRRSCTSVQQFYACFCSFLYECFVLPSLIRCRWGRKEERREKLRDSLIHMHTFQWFTYVRCCSLWIESGHRNSRCRRRRRCSLKIRKSQATNSGSSDACETDLWRHDYSV